MNGLWKIKKVKYHLYNFEDGFPKSCISFYINGVSRKELPFHLSENLINEINKQDRFTLLREILDSKILSWAAFPEMLSKLRKSITVLQDKVQVNSEIVDRLLGYHHCFILCSSDFEFGFPHTNSEYIFLPKDFIKNNNIHFLAKTLLHEMTHIYQRFSRDRFILDRLCSDLGYVRLPNNIKVILCDVPTGCVRIENPDLYNHDLYLYKEGNIYYIFLLYLDVKKKTMQRFSYFLAGSREGRVYKIWYFRLCNFIPKTRAISNQYDHPYEVIACFWADVFVQEK